MIFYPRRVPPCLCLSWQAASSRAGGGAARVRAADEMWLRCAIDESSVRFGLKRQSFDMVSCDAIQCDSICGELLKTSLISN